MGALLVYEPESPECGDWGYYPGDINKDCYVDFTDLAIFLSEWPNCTDLANPNCK